MTIRERLQDGTEKEIWEKPTSDPKILNCDLCIPELSISYFGLRSSSLQYLLCLIKTYVSVLCRESFQPISFLSSSIVRETSFLFSPFVQINKVRSPEQMIFLELFLRTQNFLAIKLNWPIEKTFFIIAQIELRNYK